RSGFAGPAHRRRAGAQSEHLEADLMNALTGSAGKVREAESRAEGSARRDHRGAVPGPSGGASVRLAVDVADRLADPFDAAHWSRAGIDVVDAAMKVVADRDLQGEEIRPQAAPRLGWVEDLDRDGVPVEPPLHGGRTVGSPALVLQVAADRTRDERSARQAESAGVGRQRAPGGVEKRQLGMLDRNLPAGRDLQ